jgi:hypothetical protein
MQSPRALLTLALTGSLVVLALAVLPTATGSSPSDGNRLAAFALANNRGPLPACHPEPSGACGGAINAVWHFIHVVNANPLTTFERARTRAAVPNAFEVSTVDEAIFVNGVETFDFTLTPPPDAQFPSWSGRWPATVTCPGQPGAFEKPCNVVGNPAVLPGENTVALYTSWTHADFEPNGVYVFKFTVHGTLNGNAVDLTATSAPILMTA